MTPDGARRLLERVARGDLSVEEGMAALGRLEVEALGFARVDHHRGVRCGFPEVIFGQGKTPAQIVAVARAVLDRSERLLVTRAAPDAAGALRETFPDARWEEAARCVTVVRDRDPRPPAGRILVVSAGTGDLPVAEEIEPGQRLDAVILSYREPAFRVWMWSIMYPWPMSTG